jgi:urease accessory protein
VPRGSHDAILINTSGGLAGGDQVDIVAEAGPNARLTLTSQAAERVYRTIGPAAVVNVRLKAGAGARLLWLPQETILFDGSALSRHIDVDLAPDATFCAVETIVFGRKAMGENITRISVRDDWSVRRAGMTMHREALALGPHMANSAATLAGAQMSATVLLIAVDAEGSLEAVRTAVGRDGGASAWNGKLIARLLGNDGLALRKALIRVLSACVGSSGLPKVWTM